MDIQLPLLDSYQATTLLRLHGYKRPIVALSAHAFNDDRERARRGL